MMMMMMMTIAPPPSVPARRQADGQADPDSALSPARAKVPTSDEVRSPTASPQASASEPSHQADHDGQESKGSTDPSPTTFAYWLQAWLMPAVRAAAGAPSAGVGPSLPRAAGTSSPPGQSSPATVRVAASAAGPGTVPEVKLAANASPAGAALTVHPAIAMVDSGLVRTTGVTGLATLTPAPLSDWRDGLASSGPAAPVVHDRPAQPWVTTVTVAPQPVRARASTGPTAGQPRVSTVATRQVTAATPTLESVAVTAKPQLTSIAGVADGHGLLQTDRAAPVGVTPPGSAPLPTVPDTETASPPISQRPAWGSAASAVTVGSAPLRPVSTLNPSPMVELGDSLVGAVLARTRATTAPRGALLVSTQPAVAAGERDERTGFAPAKETGLKLEQPGWLGLRPGPWRESTAFAPKSQVVYVGDSGEARTPVSVASGQGRPDTSAKNATIAKITANVKVSPGDIVDPVAAGPLLPAGPHTGSTNDEMAQSAAPAGPDLATPRPAASERANRGLPGLPGAGHRAPSATVSTAPIPAAPAESSASGTPSLEPSAVRPVQAQPAAPAVRESGVPTARELVRGVAEEHDAGGSGSGAGNNAAQPPRATRQGTGFAAMSLSRPMPADPPEAGDKRTAATHESGGPSPAPAARPAVAPDTGWAATAVAAGSGSEPRPGEPLVKMADDRTQPSPLLRPPTNDRPPSGVHRLQVQVSPADVGPIQVEVRSRHGELSVQLASAAADARQFLQGHRGELVDRLELAGLRVQEVSVHPLADSSAWGAANLGQGSQSDARQARQEAAGPGLSWGMDSGATGSWGHGGTQAGQSGSEEIWGTPTVPTPGHVQVRPKAWPPATKERTGLDLLA